MRLEINIEDLVREATPEQLNEFLTCLAVIIGERGEREIASIAAAGDKSIRSLLIAHSLLRLARAMEETVEVPRWQPGGLQNSARERRARGPAPPVPWPRSRRSRRVGPSTRPRRPLGARKAEEAAFEDLRRAWELRDDPTEVAEDA